MTLQARVRVKTCGIRSSRDLDSVLSAGVDAIGLISGTTHFSEDSLTPDQARELAAQVPPFVATVLVTHLVDAEEILALADYVGVSVVQVHGLVDIETVRRVKQGLRGRSLIRAVHVTEDLDLTQVEKLFDVVDALVLDTRTADRLGGTGQVHDWPTSARICEMASAAGVQVILAGGLNASNVRNSIAVVRPYAVDVNSGVDDAAGDKSQSRVQRFACEVSKAAAESADLQCDDD